MEDLKREIKKAPVTAALIIINIIVFLIVDITGGSENIQYMLKCGASYTPWIIEYKEYYRIFTCMFLHFGITHLMNNMLTLLVLGQKLEAMIGKVRMIVVYLLGGIVGNLLSLYMDLRTDTYAVSAGASGAVFAVMGAMVYVILRHRGRVSELTIKRFMLMVLFSIYLGVSKSGVDNAAHIGGLVGGFLTAVLVYHPQKKIWRA